MTTLPYDPKFYAATHRGNAGDVEFYRGLCEKAETVLELGCGSGRVLQAVLSPTATGVGIDLHDGLLELARVHADETGGRARCSFERGDMRTLSLGRRFERVLIPYSGLFCLEDTRGLSACLQTAAAHLSSDGLLALDTYAADGFHLHTPEEDVGELDAWNQLEDVEVDGVKFHVHERSRWDRSTQTIVAHYRYVCDDGSVYEASLPQRYVLAEELMLASMHAGLEPVALWGDFDQSPYDPDHSEHMIFVARHATDGSPDPRS